MPLDRFFKVSATAANPVAVKLREAAAPTAGEPRICGWDAVEVAERIDAGVEGFVEICRSFYAGGVNRPSANSELYTVDELIGALAQKSLSGAPPAALPLTSIAAYELLSTALASRAVVYRHGGVCGHRSQQDALNRGFRGSLWPACLRSVIHANERPPRKDRRFLETAVRNHLRRRHARSGCHEAQVQVHLDAFGAHVHLAGSPEPDTNEHSKPLANSPDLDCWHWGRDFPDV